MNDLWDDLEQTSDDDVGDDSDNEPDMSSVIPVQRPCSTKPPPSKRPRKTAKKPTTKKVQDCYNFETWILIHSSPLSAEHCWQDG